MAENTIPLAEAKRLRGNGADSSAGSKLSVLSVLPPLVPEAPALPPGLLPDPLRAWLEDIADRAQLPLEMVAAPAVVGLSSVIGRSVGICPKRRDNWTVVPNLWGASIARPGNLKSYSMAEPLKPLNRLAAQARERFKQESYEAEADKMVLEAQIAAAKDDLKAAAKKAEAEKMETHKRRLANLYEQLESAEPTARRYTTSDTTIEKLAEIVNQNPRGILIQRDELYGWLKSLDRADRPGGREFYMEGWSGLTGLEVDRIGRGSIDVPAIALSIYGTMQPGKLQSYVRAALRGGIDDDGLLQRFQILVWPEFSRKWENVDRSPDTAAFERVAELFRALDTELPGLTPDLKFPAIIPTIRFDKEAQELFDEWRDELEIRLRSEAMDNTPAFASHLAKYRSLMPTLALIFHLAEVVPRGDLPAVSASAAKGAAGWCVYLEQHARKVYAAELNPDLASAHALMDKIKVGQIEDKMNVRDVYRRGWKGLTDPDQVYGGLRILEKYRIAGPAEIYTGGNPAEVIRLYGGG